jgi:hypothetical protein
MVIFQALPSRLFPVVVNAILPHLGEKQVLEFHYPYYVKRYEDWLKPDNILRGLPRECVHQRFDGFMYGVFGSDHLNIKPEEDFICTLLHHPVDQVYECFAYLYFTHKTCGPRTEENVRNNPWARYLAEIEIFKGFEDVSLERFIDLVLQDFDFSFDYKDVQYLPIPENIYGYGRKHYFNYIGKYTELEPFFKKLSSVLEINIPLPKDQRANAFKGEYYKRDLLEKKFEKEIHYYNNLITSV